MLTAEGFKRKRYADYLTELEEEARRLYGADVDLSERSPLGLFVKLLAYEAAEGSEDNENTYNSAFYDTAEGASLDRVGKTNIAITRIGKNKAKVSLLFTVDAGTTVETGQILKTSSGIEFVTIETKTDDGSGQITVQAEAKEAGAQGNVAANTITEMVTYISGVQSVTNPEPAQYGRNAETDTEFRQRYEVSTSKPGASTTDSIRATLLDEVEGLRAAIVIENETDTTDADGRPPHSFECVVYGGNRTDIANVILKKKAGAIRAYGQELEVVKDASGRDKQIGFTYAPIKPIYIRLNIQTDATFPADGAETLKLEAIKYIGGTDAQSNVYAGLSMGEDVVLAKLISAGFSAKGVTDVSVELSTDGVTYSAANVVVGDIEVAETSYDKVAVNIV